MWFYYEVPVSTIIAKQSTYKNKYNRECCWICNKCKNWGGGIKCKLDYFIAFEEANTGDCVSFQGK